MFMQGYFYWSGVVINVIVLFWVLVGCYMTARHWHWEWKNRKKYARREVGRK